MIIQHTKPFFGTEEIERITAVINSRNVNEGEEAARLVSTIAGIVGAKGGVPVSTGTLGLHLALKALGVGTEKDEVIIPDFACRSILDSVRMAGGTPVFCDINLDDYSLDKVSAESAVNENTKAIILPHMYGCPADFDAFLSLGVPIIEDCAHSLGTIYRGRAVGGLGTLAVFSIEGSKLIAGGEGGVVLSKEENVVESLRELRLGRYKDYAFHYRLSDLNAALALVQIGKLSFMIKRRRTIASFYREKLSKLEERGCIILPNLFADRESVFYRFVIVCAKETSSLITILNEKGILARNPLSSGCLSDVFAGIKLPNPSARKLATNGLSLPIYPDLTDDEMWRIVDTLKLCLEGAGEKVSFYNPK